MVDGLNEWWAAGDCLALRPGSWSALALRSHLAGGLLIFKHLSNRREEHMANLHSMGAPGIAASLDGKAQVPGCAVHFPGLGNVVLLLSTCGGASSLVLTQ